MDNELIENTKKERKKTWLYCVLVLAGIIIGASLMFTYNSYSSYSRAKDLYQKIATVEYVLDNEYLYDYDEEEVADFAAWGMTAGLKDPYTVYYPSKEFSSFSEDANGDFVGIGITVVANTEKNVIEIESVTEGAPADKAGILPGDILIKVDDESYSAMNYAEAVSRVRGLHYEDGSVGKEVKIGVVRDGKEKEFNIIREKIHIESVESKLLDNGIGYLKISGFNTADGKNLDTFEEFKTHFGELKEQGAQKLIIDVRDNGGGDLHVVTKIIDMLVPKGVLMYSEDKNGKRDYMYSDKNEVDIPMAVLVNGYSASASELLTGALKDYEKATIIGTKTYGKGVMQRVYPLSDGSGMVVTVAKYYTPKGTCVQDTGITPDIEIEGEEKQMEKAIEILR